MDILLQRVEELYIVNMITKKRVHETNMGHRIISPDKVLLDNKEIINQILEKISKTYNICIGICFWKIKWWKKRWLLRVN